MLRHFLLASVCCAFLVTTATFAATAQLSGPASIVTGTMSGTIVDPTHKAISGAAIRMIGPVSRSAVTDGAGAFRIDNLPPGVYTINVTRAGFTPVRADATVLSGALTNTNLQLAASSLSSLQTIGRITSTTNASNALNTTAASVATSPGSSFIDQGQTNVDRVLSQLPGVEIGFASGGGPLESNAASSLAAGIPIIRGSLPYETESLIDGHPISIGEYGTFSPTFLSPYVLQDVEVVKGPGASSTNINYAIGGTINFRTIEPTSTSRRSLDLGVDQFGGQSANLRATGTVGDKHLGYAFDYATQGTEGPAHGFTALNPLVNLGQGALVNGQVVCGNPAATGCGLGSFAVPNNFLGGIEFTTPIAICCSSIPLESSGRNELAKLRYSFSPSTSLTFTYLGGQLRGSLALAQLFALPNYEFTPPPGYTGSLAAGTNIPFDLEFPENYYSNANLYSAEFLTALGPVTFDARYYAANVNNVALLHGSDATLNYTGNIYGGLPLGNDLTPTIFNGLPGTVQNLGQIFNEYSSDRLNGVTVQLTIPIASNVFSLSYDTVRSKSSASTIFSNAADDEITVPPGSGQSFQTFAFRGQFELARGLQASLSDYATLYTDHYTLDFGHTFTNSSHAYNAPRLAFAAQPTRHLAVRAATGFSIAPPYVALLTNSTAQPNAYGGPQYFTVTKNSGGLSPETAFGWNLGADQRLGNYTVLSGDIYETTLHNQFLTTTYLSSTPYFNPPQSPFGGPPGNLPLYVTQTENLGHSRYEGIELSLKRNPEVGLGYKVQGDLLRAFAYNLPPNFYATASGPYTTNLGILANENFQASGSGYNGISYSRVPYSQGYAELNYRFRHGSYFQLGVTYYGPNNTYNEPPFGVVNGSYQQQLGSNVNLLLAATNITSAYQNFYPYYIGGVPTPLANGKLGYTSAQEYGPSTTSLTLQVKF